MVVIGITGSVGMGKTFVLNLFKFHNIITFNADQEVARLLKEKKIIKKIAAVFPSVVNDHNIDKAALAEIVFNDKLMLKKLENIIHPIVKRSVLRFIARSKARHKKIIAIEVPLLFEKSYQKFFDVVIVVSSPGFIQKRRLLKRPSITLDKIKQIEKHQLNDFTKRIKSDYIIHTGLYRAVAVREVKNIIGKLCVKSS
jgi:dephospho-CoA kinase